MLWLHHDDLLNNVNLFLFISSASKNSEVCLVHNLKPVLMMTKNAKKNDKKNDLHQMRAFFQSLAFCFAEQTKNAHDKSSTYLTKSQSTRRLNFP